MMASVRQSGVVEITSLVKLAIQSERQPIAFVRKRAVDMKSESTWKKMNEM
jgi:hypothetical protein